MRGAARSPPFRFPSPRSSPSPRMKSGRFGEDRVGRDAGPPPRRRRSGRPRSRPPRRGCPWGPNVVGPLHLAADERLGPEDLDRVALQRLALPLRRWRARAPRGGQRRGRRSARASRRSARAPARRGRPRGRSARGCRRAGARAWRRGRACPGAATSASRPWSGGGQLAGRRERIGRVDPRSAPCRRPGRWRGRTRRGRGAPARPRTTAVRRSATFASIPAARRSPTSSSERSLQSP